MAVDIDLIWVKREAEYFRKPDWTGQIRLIRLNKFGRARTAQARHIAQRAGRIAGAETRTRRPSAESADYAKFIVGRAFRAVR